MKEFNIALAGVGGQGTLMAAEILGTAAIRDELNVRVSEIHGMAQRGGAVVSCVRIGESVMSPTIIDGQAEVLLGFEPLETARNLKYASDKTLVIMNPERVPPIELAVKNLKYPSMDKIKQKIRRFTEKLIIVNASELAEVAGNNLAQNSVLVGGLVAVTGFPVKMESVLDALKQLVPAKTVDTNIKAFQLGYEFVKKQKTG